MNPSFLALAQAPVNLQQYRHRKTKHFTPKWKKLRGQKVVKIELPNLNEKFEDLTVDEQRTRMKERGITPARPWMERPFYISCTGGIFEPYVPPEGDGKVSSIKGVAKEKLEFLEKKGKSMLAVRKIRSYDEDFEPPEFAEQAQDIYIKAHEQLMAKNKYKLRDFITERAYPEMMHNIKDKTVRWKFIKSLEIPHVIHARCTDVISKENIFGQVTVRFHTQQVLAIYDRFGRLMHGSEILAKDVLEYVVFEKHLANEYGTWRLHDKIVPDWMPAKQPSYATYREDDPIKEETESEIVPVDTKEADKKPETAAVQ